MKYLISQTTREEREKIVADSLGELYGSCDGCMPGLADMYEPYIEGKMELSEINMAFQAHYDRGGESRSSGNCGYRK